MEKESIVAPVQIVLDAPAAARQLVASEIQCHPGFADLHNRLGLLDVYDGRPDRAARSFREALGINPGYFWGASNLSLALIGVGQVDEALSVLRSDSIFTDHPDYARCRATVLLEADLPDDVPAVLDADPGPETPFHHHLRGLAFLKQGRAREAQQAFLRAAEGSPLIDRLYRQRELLGPGALEKISPREAAAPIRVFPGLYELYDFFAEIYARHGFRSRALQSYEQGQVLWPDRSRHAWNLGRLASWMGDPDEAKGGFLEAIDRNPHMVDAHIALGMEYAAGGEVHLAIEAFERAAELRPGFADVRYQLGLAYMEAERFGDAVTAFRAALSINPSFHFARQNLALALQRTGQTVEAIGEYERMLTMGRKSADLSMSLGLAYLETGDAAKAEEAFREGIRINPGFALNYYHLGMACRRLGRRDESRAAWKLFLERHGHSELSIEVRRQLDD
jgi:tetratricopeptide (TPR) repeat protein